MHGVQSRFPEPNRDGHGINLRSYLSGIVRAIAPKLPPYDADTQVNILPSSKGNPPFPAPKKDALPPFGTNPPIYRGTVSSELYERQIQGDPRELWYLSLPSKLTPKQVLQILRSALGGDLWQLWQLVSLMLDSWPMLRKCSHELRSAVAQTSFIAHPYAEEGEEPTASAKEKCDLVNRAIKRMKPNPFTDEKGFSGMVYDLCDAFLTGMSMIELLWVEKEGELWPRASAWVHPRHFSFTNQGVVTIVDSTRAYTWTQWSYIEPDPNKFILSQYMSKSGSALGSGMARPVAWAWSAVMFNREWMLNFSQKFGTPFRVAHVPTSTPPDELAKIDQMLADAGDTGWVRLYEGQELDVLPAGTLGPQNPHEAIRIQADDEVQLLFLGQTATTKGTPGKLGGEDTHAEVRRERIEDMAGWIASTLTEQFAAAILRVNYGNDDECPIIQPDFTEVANPLQVAQRYQILTAAGVPILAEEFYKDNSLTQPDEGDKVIINGKIGLLGDTEEEVEMGPPEPLTPAAPPQGQEPKPETAKEPGLEQPTQKRATKPAEPKEPVNRGTDMTRLLGIASESDLVELKGLLLKAKGASHVNGEMEAVQAKIKQLSATLTDL